MDKLQLNQSLAPMGSLLNQMRELRSSFNALSESSIQTGALGVGERGPDKKTIGFEAMLTQALDQVNTLQSQSSELRRAYELSDPNVSLIDVTLASQKSSVAFDALVEVRRKFIEAYKEIMSMQV